MSRFDGQYKNSKKKRGAVCAPLLQIAVKNNYLYVYYVPQHIESNEKPLYFI